MDICINYFSRHSSESCLTSYENHLDSWNVLRNRGNGTDWCWTSHATVKSLRLSKIQEVIVPILYPGSAEENSWKLKESSPGDLSACLGTCSKPHLHLGR